MSAQPSINLDRTPITFGGRSNAVTSNSGNESWRAQGFINLYLPTKSGGRRKLGAIPLRESRDSERALLQWLNEDPERVNKIVERLVADYQPATSGEEAAFDLD